MIEEEKNALIKSSTSHLFTKDEAKKLKRRDDLQIWRGYSILAVLLFHLWPNLFPNGFVGVDIFFVLSGFLMSKIYCCPSKSTFSFSDILNFYFKRIKRIAPIYLAVITLVFGLLSKVMLVVELNTALKDAIWASLFLTNIQDFITKLDYFDVQSTSRFFRHCWSLSVEMQFYLIFPFIAFIKTKVSLNFYRSFLLVLFILSFIYQITRTNSIEAYESTFSRLWQFIIGILAESAVLKGNKNYLHVTSIIAVLGILFPLKLPKVLLNLIVVLTGIIISYSSSTPIKPLSFISKKLNFVYFGNISYIVYLLHWPLITYMKYTTIHNKLSIFDGFIAFLSSIMLSVLIHNIIEKPILSFCGTVKKLVFTLAILYFSFFMVVKYHPKISPNFSPSILTYEIMTQISNFSNNFEPTIILPSEWSNSNELQFAQSSVTQTAYIGEMPECKESDSIYATKSKDFWLNFCETVNLNSIGNLTAVVIGNSFAGNFWPLLMANQKFKNLYKIQAGSCPFPDAPGNRCYNQTHIALTEIPKIKPDIIFILQAYVIPVWKNVVDVTQDPVYQITNNAYQLFQNYTSAIISLKPQFYFPFHVSSEYLRRKFNGFDIDMAVENKPQLTDWAKILTSMPCPKCLWVDYKEVFCNSNFCNPIDSETKLPVFGDDFHVNPLGVKRLKPKFDLLIDIAISWIKNGNKTTI